MIDDLVEALVLGNVVKIISDNPSDKFEIILTKKGKEYLVFTIAGDGDNNSPLIGGVCELVEYLQDMEIVITNTVIYN